MRALTLQALALLMLSVVTDARAHSLKELERLLGDRERYFQVVDKATPDLAMQDADGRSVRIAELRGKVVVLHFIYAGCPDVCPLHAERIAEVQSLVNETPMREHVRFVTITTDPRNDTPDVLRAYGPLHGLKSDNWMFLTIAPDQPEDATRQLAAQFGHTFQKMENEYQLHGIVTGNVNCSVSGGKGY
jgi:protein SCO1/2